MLIVFSLLLIMAISAYLVLNHPQFGKLPKGDRLIKISKSPHYHNGSFKNKTFTPDLAEGENYYTIIKSMLFEKKIDRRPTKEIPNIKTDLTQLPIHEDMLIWFGHSSYYMQLDGKRFLVDPVFSGHASPFSFSIKAFEGSNNYGPESMPTIDYLFITHDHWDHLDYKTIIKLKPKIKFIVCGLGVGAHLEHWGFDASIIHEMDWDECYKTTDGFTINSFSTRHFSGRGFKRNTSLWLSFLIETANLKIYIGGDSGYDSHFSEIGKNFGEIDLAIIENGQYDKKWKYIHLLPEQFMKAVTDLRAKSVIPVHSGKFALGNHPWYEPLKLLTENTTTKNHDESAIYEQPTILTPQIGEKVYVHSNQQSFQKWWEKAM